ncbi:MAG TPA: M3 family oligoendopeptidase [bacterium]
MAASPSAAQPQSAPPPSAAGVRWNLGDLYAGLDDPQLTQDRDAVLAEAKAFADAYRGKVAALSAEGLRAAVERREAIAARAGKALIFAHLLFAGDTSHPKHGALVAATQEAQSEVQRAVLFFDLEWLAVPEAQAEGLLADPALARYRHYLEVARRDRPHTLSEPEEKVLAVTGNTGRLAFQRLFDSVVGGIRCTVEGRDVSLEEALSGLYQAARSHRKAAAQAITQSLLGQQKVLTFALNTLVQDHADEDRLRLRPHPMLARNLANEITQPTVDALLDACDRGMGLVHRYYGLKRRLLGVDKLFDYDRYAPIGMELPRWSWPEARRLVLQAYGAFSPRMAEIVGQFLELGWVDAEVRPGKTGGAFSASTLPDVHPYILLNYTDTPRDVMTLAHELGHGIHQYLARGRGYFQQGTPLTTAETASVFGEMLAFQRLLAEQPDPRQQLALLCGKLEDMFMTVHRQASLTRFEQTVHRARRTEGELDAVALGTLWMKANRAMYGDAVTLTEGYTHWWGYISHFIHTPFYCYAYSFGELLVLALYQRYQQEGAGFVPRYLELLEAGGSKSPEDLLRPLGVDVNDPTFWDQGMALMEGWLQRAEALAAQLGTRS